MTASEAFSRVKFYVYVGISHSTSHACICVAADPATSNGVMQPRYGRKYVVHTRFEFYAPKKAPYATIIINLKQANIYPESNIAKFSPPVNPDNRFYTELPLRQLDLILKIVRSTISGMCLNEAAEPDYKEYVTPPDQLADIMENERPRICLNRPFVAVLNTDGKKNHMDLYS